MDTVDLKQQFRDLLKASGWTQAEAARQLCITPGAISQIMRVNSPVKPSPVTLRLFKLLLVRRCPEPDVALKDAPRPPELPLEAEERDLIEALRQIPKNARRHLVKAFSQIVASHLAPAGVNADRSNPERWVFR